MTLYLATLYRFGDTFESVSEDEQQAVANVIDGYIETFKYEWGEEPSAEELFNAIECTERREYELNSTYFMQSKME